MELSARNQLVGTVQEIKKDAIMAEITLKLDGGTELVSVITSSSAERLGLAAGKRVTIIIKSTEVMLAAET